MALAKSSLGNIVQIGAGTTSAVYTVSGSKKAYVKSLLIYNLSTLGSQNVRVHVVPNSGGSAGTASSTTQIARVGLSTNDTYFFETAYPITLESNGDTIQVYNEGVVTDSINVLVLGDKES